MKQQCLLKKVDVYCLDMYIWTFIYSLLCIFFLSQEKIDACLTGVFLYEAKALYDYNTFFHMFNREFGLPIILDQHSDFLEEYLTEFKKLTASREVNYQGVNYIHAIDLVQERTSETARLNKKFVNLPEGAKSNVLNASISADFSRHMLDLLCFFFCKLHRERKVIAKVWKATWRIH